MHIGICGEELKRFSVFAMLRRELTVLSKNLKIKI